MEDTATYTEEELKSSDNDAQPWLAMIEDAEKAFEDYNDRADKIDKLYSSLAELASNARDREFQLFWANVEVLKPSIYSRPPVPVCVPKFKDRRPLYRVSSELLERCSVVAFDIADIDTVMRLIRDDVAVVGRGVPWVRYESDKGEKVCVEHLDRKDFLHNPARKWPEVCWVARRAWLTEGKAEKRFGKEKAEHLTYELRREDKENGAATKVQQAPVWEIWHKDENKVVWVSPGCNVILDQSEPHLKLEGFFPCPKPAYSTVQRGSLIPVPDVVYYRDQLEEINELTGRIHALSQSLKVRGFYPAGKSDIGDAVETALKSLDDRQVLVPVSNWAAFGGTTGDPIVWLPIEMIATVVTGLVELRRQIIEDVYQIMGLSDIMRGSTEEDETATAQQIKVQYGSVRVRDKQNELVRVARDINRIACEIMAENFKQKTLLEMSQMQVPTNAEIRQQVEAIEANAEQTFQKKVQEAQSNPELMQQAQQNPEAAQQKIMELQQEVIAGAKAEIEKLQAKPTIEQVMAFLRDNRIRPFVLDIETDSTIQPDEDAEKQRRTEFMQVMNQTLVSLNEMITVQPAAAPFAAQLLKFAMAPFRAGRELEGAVEEFADQMVEQAKQPKPNPEAEALQAEHELKREELQSKVQIEAAKLQADQQGQEEERQAKAEEHQAKMAELQAKIEMERQKAQLELQKLQMEIAAKQEELQIKRETMQVDAQAKAQQAQIQTESAQQQAAIQSQSAQQQADIKAQQAEQQAMHSEQEFEQKTAMNEQAFRSKQQQPRP